MSTLRSLASRMASLLACRRCLYASVSAMSSGYTLLVGVSLRVLAARFWALRSARFWRRRDARVSVALSGLAAAAGFSLMAAGCLASSHFLVALAGFSATALRFSAAAIFSALRALRFWRRRDARVSAAGATSELAAGCRSWARFSAAAIFWAAGHSLATVLTS